jgi:drug/metabolite transporter (DMT)-like permease
MILQSVGWILQAMALDRAPLVVVQSLTALSLVIALPLGAWLTDQHIGRREIGGAVLTLVGIIAFLSAGQPQAGSKEPSAATWWTACLAIFALVVLLWRMSNRREGAERALILGVAAGLGFGLQGAVTKTFVTEVGGGVLGLLSSWSVYVLIISAIAGFVLQQSALKTGFLAAAMASSNSVTLFASVVLGIIVFGEHLSKTGGTHRAMAFLGLALTVGGIALLAGSTPAEARETPAPDIST